ncbi:hypothetical protein Tco_0450538 [Tanacetum coccineum]
MMEVDRLLAERLQSKEREELTDEEKEKLFMELMEKRRKRFAALRAQEKRNRPPTKAQKRPQIVNLTNTWWIYIQTTKRKTKKIRKKVERKQLKVQKEDAWNEKGQMKEQARKNPQRNKE